MGNGSSSGGVPDGGRLGYRFYKLYPMFVLRTLAGLFLSPQNMSPKLAGAQIEEVERMALINV
jgi:hypothetical protein